MTQKNGFTYEFGEFRLDPKTKILYHADAPVSLKPKIVETLLVLIENAGEVVAKDDLMNAVWRDTFVAENNLSVNIYALRKAFAELDGKGGERTYIQTVPRRGFRFVVPVSEVFKTNGNGNGKIDAENLTETKIEKPLTEEAAGQSPNAEGVANSFSSKARRKSRRNDASPMRFNRRTFLIATVLSAVLLIGGGVGAASFYALRENRQAGKNQTDGERVVLPPPPQYFAAERGTKSAEARDLYLRGYQLWQTRINERMSEGVEYFKRAIEIDPQFSDAYLGVADSLSMMNNNQREWREADEYAQKALALAPDSADAHATLGFIAALNKWQWTEAENYFKRALELDPNCGKAHQWYAALLLLERRFDEAETHLKRAIEIYPLSPNYNADLTELYSLNGRESDRQTHCLQMERLSLQPTFAHCHNDYALAIREKRFDDVVRMEYEGRLEQGRTPEQIENADWYKAYRRGGWRGWLAHKIERMENSPDAYNAAFNLSVSYAQIGDRENALRILEKAYKERTFLLPFANVRPEFEDLRGDARFQDLMRRVGLRRN